MPYTKTLSSLEQTAIEDQVNLFTSSVAKDTILAAIEDASTNSYEWTLLNVNTLDYWRTYLNDAGETETIDDILSGYFSDRDIFEKTLNSAELSYLNSVVSGLASGAAKGRIQSKIAAVTPTFTQYDCWELEDLAKDLGSTDKSNFLTELNTRTGHPAHKPPHV